MAKIDESKKNYISAVGRRREAAARVRLWKKIPDNLLWGEMAVKKGDIIVNQKAITVYFPSAVEKTVYEKPLRVTNTLNKFAFTIQVAGGGRSGQLDAAVLGIARVLDRFDKETFHDILRKNGLLTRDPRTRQRRNVGMGGKSRRKKQSPKR